MADETNIENLEISIKNFETKQRKMKEEQKLKEIRDRERFARNSASGCVGYGNGAFAAKTLDTLARPEELDQRIYNEGRLEGIQMGIDREKIFNARSTLYTALQVLEHLYGHSRHFSLAKTHLEDSIMRLDKYIEEMIGMPSF